jgi:hypothetical protein
MSCSAPLIQESFPINALMAFGHVVGHQDKPELLELITGSIHEDNGRLFQPITASASLGAYFSHALNDVTMRISLVTPDMPSATRGRDQPRRELLFRFQPVNLG